MGGETLKSRGRRERQGFFERYCQGRGIDIGCGDDPLTPEVDKWDMVNGDATDMVGVEPDTYDFVYTSHLLEHLFYPVVAIQNWWKILKVGGHLIIVVPHKELYERKDCLVPPLHEDRHKMFFLPDRADPPHTLSLLDTVNLALGADPREFVYMMTCDEGRIAVDAVSHPQGEYQIELVIRKGQRPRFGDTHLPESPI
jgi:SAM-dependent methyltransferase